VKKVGNAHVFEPVVTRRATVRRLFGELLGFFGGSPRTLMAQLVEAGHLTLEDLREAEETLARLEASKAGGSDEGAAERGAPKGSVKKPGGEAARRGGAKGRAGR
jgi:hypothetical protein